MGYTTNIHHDFNITTNHQLNAPQSRSQHPSVGIQAELGEKVGQLLSHLQSFTHLQ